MEEWKEYRLGEVIETNISQYSLKENWESILYLDTGNITKNQISNIESFFGNKNLPSRARRKVKKDDIVYSSVRPNLCHYGYMNNPPSNLLVSTGFIVITVKKELADSRFIYYYLTKNEIVKHLHAIGEQAVSTYPSIKPSDIEDLPINLPSLENQQKIASILKSLDDKIAINRRINDNLEQQAQALFKSWFVDFEPFKDGEFVESELGMIPKGWKVGKLGEICQFKRGKNLLSRDAQFGDVPVVAGGLEPACYHNLSNTKSPVVTVSGSGANAGFMRMYYQEVWASDCSFIDSSCDNLYFVYYFLAINRRLLRHAQVGAVQPHVKPADIHDFDIVIPPYDKIKKFQVLVSPTIDKKGKIEKEAKNLAKLRDTLLPRLMSGKLKPNEITL
jgi:type I restriction enzyme S subunit